jgi:hypothetical protein
MKNRLLPMWKVGVIVTAVGVVTLIAAACTGTQPVQKTAQVLSVDANTVMGSDGVKNPADICVASSRFQQGVLPRSILTTRGWRGIRVCSSPRTLNPGPSRSWASAGAK